MKNLTHSEIISKIKASGYFNIKELVSEEVYKRDGERAWRYFDTRLLITIYFIRKKLDKGFNVNNWATAKAGDIIYDERGLRENISDIVSDKTKKRKLYLSGHTMGCAIDFKVSGLNSSEVRKWLLEIQNELPFKIRLENTLNGKQISWVHLDVYDEDKNPKVYLMNL